MAEITKVKAAPASPAIPAKKMKHPDATIPSYVGQTITSFLVFIMAATMRGTVLTQFFIFVKLNATDPIRVLKILEFVSKSDFHWNYKYTEFFRFT